MNERPSPSYGRTSITKTGNIAPFVFSQVPANPDVPAVRLYTESTVEAAPSGAKDVKASERVWPSLESFQLAVRRRWPSFLRTIVQESEASMVADSMVPPPPGWSVPSATMVSEPPPKSKVYLSPATFSTFIWSVNLLLLDGSSFHSPTKVSFAAHDGLVPKV